MDSSRLLTKAFLALSVASAIAVVILFNVASAGLSARLLVYAFLAGLLASGIATALSFGSRSPHSLRPICSAILGVYVLTAVVVVLWVVVAKPPFG